MARRKTPGRDPFAGLAESAVAGGQSAGGPARFAQSVLKLLRLGWPIGLGLAVYVGLCLGLWRYAEARSGRSSLERAAVALKLPPWLEDRPEDVQQIRRLAQRALENRHFLARDLPARLADAYRASPWVKDVKSIRREFPDQIIVELEIRRPFAAVRIGQPDAAVRADHAARYFIVDRDGIRLPLPSTNKPPAQLPLITITAPRLAAPPPGRPFAQRAVADAVQVIARARDLMSQVPEPDALDVHGAEIGDLIPLGRDRRHRLTVLCRAWDGRRTRIIWGAHFRKGEIVPYPLRSAAEKLEALKKQLAAVAQSGRVARYIDVSVSPSVYKLHSPTPPRSPE